MPKPFPREFRNDVIAVARQGDRVDFTGQFVVHDAAFPAQVGVDDAEGAAQLAAQAAHIQVAKSALALSAG